MHPSSPPGEIRWAKNGHLQDLAGGIQPEVGPFGEFSPKISDLRLRCVLKTSKAFRGPRDIKGRSEVIGQTVMRLILVDQPQGHAPLVRIEVENPSLQFHKAPLRSGELSPRRRAVFPGRGRSKAELLPWGCRDTGRRRPECSNGPGQRGGQNAAGPLAATLAGTFSIVPRFVQSIGQM